MVFSENCPTPFSLGLRTVVAPSLWGEGAYQTESLSSGGRYIPSPSFTPKAV